MGSDARQMKCPVGIDIIDRQHLILLTLLEELLKKLNRKGLDLELVQEYLIKVRAYANEHFSLEESMMKAVGQEAFDVNRRAHEEFWDRLTELEEFVKSDPAAAVDHVVTLTIMLHLWIEKHICKVDCRLKELAKQR